jgi:DNA-binding CsgD family transcriptional regulator
LCLFAFLRIFGVVTRLSAADFGAVLSFLEHAHASEGPAPIVPGLLDELARVVRCDHAAFFELDHPRRVLSERVVSSWMTRPWHGISDEVWACSRTVELHRRKLASGAGPVVLSEVFDRRLRRRPDWNPNLRDGGAVDEIHLDLDPPRHWKAQLAVFGTRDFGPRERLIMRLVQPHLAAVYRAAWLRRRLARLTEPLDDGAVLTPREREVMRRVGEGLSNAEIARVLVVELSTVHKHLEHVYAKLGVRSRTAALAKLRLPSDQEIRAGGSSSVSSPHR